LKLDAKNQKTSTPKNLIAKNQQFQTNKKIQSNKKNLNKKFTTTKKQNVVKLVLLPTLVSRSLLRNNFPTR